MIKRKKCIKEKTIFLSIIITGCILLFLAPLQEKRINSVTVPVILDHNRMLIEAEFQRKDGSWRKARLWVDTGNPGFYLSEKFARDLGMDFPVDKVNPQVPPPALIPKTASSRLRLL
jgi:hypothetical protein